MGKWMHNKLHVEEIGYPNPDTGFDGSAAQEQYYNATKLQKIK